MLVEACKEAERRWRLRRLRKMAGERERKCEEFEDRTRF